MNIMVSEISQTQKNKYCMILLRELYRIHKFTATECGTAVTGWGVARAGGMGSYCILHRKFLFVMMKKF